MAPLLGGHLPFVVAVLVLALLKANGEDSTSIEPGIRVHQDVDVIVTQKNGQLLLNCSVTRTTDFGKLEYSWLKDDKLIDFEEVNPKIRLFSNGSLYIKKVRKRKRKTDEGVYTCIAKNDVGSVIANQVRVQVANVAKTFLREPQSQEAYVGGTARFECAINAFPAAIFVWQKYRKALPQDDHKYTLLPSGVLHINNLELDDTGDYRCITSYGELHTLPDVVDSIHWRKSSEASLDVKPAEAKRKSRFISGNNLNVTVKAGETAILECLVDGSPLPSVTWSREDRKPLNVKYVSYFGHKNLKIRSVSKEDAGTYICTASSRGYSDIKTTLVLTVLVPPVISTAPLSQKWPRARTIILNCVVDAVPEARIRWYQNGQEIERVQPFEFKPNALVIYNAEMEHTGYYQCIAENSVGRDSALARLEVWEPAGSPKPPKGLKASALSSTKIFIQWNKSVTREDLPIITYVVNVLPHGGGENGLKNDFVTGSEDVLNKTMDGLKPFTMYTVFVKAFNKKGASQKSKEVMVRTLESVPVAPPEIVLSILPQGMINVEWKEMAPSQRAGVVTQYKVYYKKQTADNKQNGEHVEVVDASKPSYNITGIEPDRTYAVRVLASTKMGYPSLSDDQWPWVTIKTPKLTTTFPTPQLSLLRRNSSTVVVRWTIIDRKNKVISYDIILRNLQAKNVIDRLSIAHPASEHTFHSLENGTLYEVTVLAKGSEESSGPIAMEFRTTDDKPTLPAESLQAKSINSNTVLLTWSQPGHTHDVRSYDVCYSQEKDLNRTCITSSTSNAEIPGLKPLTRYKFSVRTHFVNKDIQVSQPLIWQINEDLRLPSAPTNITYIVVSPGTVELHWKAPTSPNGVVITSYIIFYNNNDEVPDTMWRNLTQTGGLTQATVQELTAASYFFKLRACTHAGQGRLSQIVVVYPKCKGQVQPVKPCLTVDPTPGPSSQGPGDKQLGIIVGVTIGIVCIVICIIVIVFRNRCFRTRDPQYNTPHGFHGNGHIPGHGNGHAVHVTTANWQTSSMPSADLDAMTPMLTSLPENAESDSKGGGTLIVTPNGVRVNGLSRSFQNGHVPNGHVTRLEGSSHLNDSGSSEEHRGLIAAMLASTDCSNGMEGSGMSAMTGASLEEIDGSLDDESNTSAPLVTAASPNGDAAMLKVTAEAEGCQAPGHHNPRAARAAAAASPILRNNGSGGSAADSSTSSHLPRSKPASGREEGEGRMDRPPTPPPPLKSSKPSSQGCSSQESPVAPGTHVDSLRPTVDAGQLPHMYVRDDGTWVGHEQPDAVV